jgi:AhpD family alkylhydroperoxidase
MTSAKEVLEELREPVRSLRGMIPEAWSGFVHLHQASMSDGALPRRVKELVALAIGVSQQCDGCIASHARGAVRAGATAEEVAETLAVTLMMGGGPASVYAPRAWAAYEEHAGSVEAPGTVERS